MTDTQILIAENELPDALNTQKVLERLGYPVAGIACSGEEAIEIASSASVGLVLMDATLQGDVKGVEAAEQIYHRFDLPVVFLTAKADDNLLEQFTAPWCYGFIVTPFEEEGLRAAIEMALHRHQTEERSRENERRLDTTLKSIGDAVITADEEGLVTFLNPAAEALTGHKQEDAPSKGLAEVFRIVEADTRSPADAPIARSLQQGVPLDLAPYLLVAADGREIAIDGNASPIRDESGHVMGVALAFRDVSERQRVEEEIRRRNRELALLNRAGQAFSSSLDLDQVITAVLEEVRHLLGAVGSSTWVFDPDTDELVCRQATGPQSEIVRDWRLAAGEGIASWVARTGHSLIVPDTHADERHFKGVDQETGLAIRSILSVPMRAKQKVIGVIQVVDTEVNRFNNDDLRLVQAMASAAAIAIDNAQLHACNRRLAVEGERQRLARELHDSATQALYSISLAAETSLNTLDQAGVNGKLVGPIEHIHSLSQSTLVEMREQIEGLHSRVVAETRLAEALTQHCDLLSEQHALSTIIMA
ncbi:MAG: GAF domain-containing protein, partial [Ardenticatenia bacterium]|nr:GAF domain-containing protein [Ardenticatenia bacterium]